MRETPSNFSLDMINDHYRQHLNLYNLENVLDPFYFNLLTRTLGNLLHACHYGILGGFRATVVFFVLFCVLENILFSDLCQIATI